MKIVMVASEARPFVKTGGLADVAYSLSKELAVIGHDVSIIMPFYSAIREKSKNTFQKVCSFPITMSWRVNEAKVYVTTESGITYYMIECNQYFARKAIYGEHDDMERFAFFTMACKEFMYRQNISPDILHVHDWHVGVLPCLIKEDDYARKFFKNTKIFLTIHNPAFQGLVDRWYVGDFYNLSDGLYLSGKVRLKNSFSTLKTGIVYSDVITTVSPTHRKELLTPEGGMGLDNVLGLREYDFYGILNGIDYLEFNPKTDEAIDAQYNAVNCMNAKAKNKEALFKELGIKDFGKPCYAMVSRLTWQKGMDLVLASMELIARNGGNVVVLGSGEEKYERQLQELRDRYPENIGIYIGYSDKFAHKFYAASDFFLMPSLFEPCGLGQMIAERYGSLPLVRWTGGLVDSVIGYDGTNEETANGFGFYEYSTNAICSVVDTTMAVYENKDLFKKLVKNAIKTDNSWKKSAKEYLKLYKK